MNDKDFDNALEALKRAPLPEEKEFKSQEEFEKEFFSKVSELPENERNSGVVKTRRRFRVWKVLTGIAAVFVLLAIAGVFLFPRAMSQCGLRGAGVVIPERYIEMDDVCDYAPDGACCAPEGMPINAVSPVLMKSKALVQSEALGGIVRMESVGAKEAFVGAILMDTERSRGIAAFNTEEYKSVSEKPFLAVATNPLSTFGADVDTACYSLLRRMVLQQATLPPARAVRLEEYLNYFTYNYPQPNAEECLKPHFEMQAAPWNPRHQLLLVGLQAHTIPQDDMPPAHYVFLIDNSGSMEDSFEMVKSAMTTLTKRLRKEDRISLVTYGGEVRVMLEDSKDKEEICRQIDELNTRGYTPGGAAIQEAYRLAKKHFIPKGNNRIILITDGDFNVGTSSEADLIAMVEEHQKECIYLTVVGCGMGNYRDNKMKMLANKGNGNYFYLDNIREAKRVFVSGLSGNMFTVARDVKFQLEFNPSQVYAYRLLGYELRQMADSDFRNDAKDSGEVGSGQQVTALYEIVPANAGAEIKEAAVPGTKPLKYSSAEQGNGNQEILTFHLRYKKPEGDDPAVEREYTMASMAPATDNWQWASTVAEAALALRHSEYADKASLKNAIKRGKSAIGEDEDGTRLEFINILNQALSLKNDD